MMLQTTPSQVQTPTMRRGHAHKRSAAISGDFDLDFFQRGPSINETLAVGFSKASSSLPSESYMQRPNSVSPPLLTSSSSTTTEAIATPSTPSVIITTPDEGEYRASRSTVPRSTATTPSPKKKHTRLNSWAHSLIKPKQKETQSSSSCKEYNSSSNDTTPEMNRVITSNYSYTCCSKPDNYQIPEAIIDLDLASGIHYDPASSIVPTNTRASFHRRTESAPELEDFFKYKMTSTNISKNSRRNSAIFEEEEDDDEAISSTSSTNHGLTNNRSLNSLNSISSGTILQNRVQSPNTYHSLTSTPTSSKTRRGGASAARYQSYYNNNILLANALKSSDSLSQITGNSSLHKPSYSSFQSQKSTLATPTSLPLSTSSSSASSFNSSIPNSPPQGFKHESRIYDMPAGQFPGYAGGGSSTPKLNSTSTVTTTVSPSKRSVTKTTKSHKKSNSLLNSISMKIRGGSFSSTKSGTKFEVSSEPEIQQQAEDAVVDDYEEELEGDSTLTPFNFGEPGPALDLSTMTPKYYNDDYDNNNRILLTQMSPSRVETPKKSKKASFFNWMKK